MFRINIRFVVLFILFFAIAYIEGGPLFYRAFYGFAAVLVLAIVMVFLNKRYLNIDIFFERNTYSSGDTGRFSVLVNNRGLLPVPYLIVINSALKRLSSRYNGDAVYVGCRSSKKLGYEVKFRNRGIYDFGSTEAKFKDTASILESRGMFSCKALINVYPKVAAIDSSLFKGINLFNNFKLSSSGIDDHYTVRDNRKYREGDNLKRINWKVSAKYNELYVKNHEIVIGEEFNIFLDMNSVNYKYDSNGIGEEHLIDTCASMVHYLTKKKLISKLYINAANARTFDIKERKDFEQLMEYFLLTKSDGDIPFVNFLKMYKASAPSLNNIALITARVDESLLEYTLQLQDRKKNLFVFYNQIEEGDGLNIIKLRKLGVKVIDASQIINSIMSL